MVMRWTYKRIVSVFNVVAPCMLASILLNKTHKRKQYVAIMPSACASP